MGTGGIGSQRRWLHGGRDSAQPGEAVRFAPQGSRCLELSGGGAGQEVRKRLTQDRLSPTQPGDSETAFGKTSHSYLASRFMRNPGVEGSGRRGGLMTWWAAWLHSLSQ